MVTIAALISLFVTSCCDCTGSRYAGYIDAHSHTNGILPYYAYADLQKFIDNPEDPDKVDIGRRCALWREISKTKFTDDKWARVGPSNRYAPGARATIEVYKDLDCDHADRVSAKINGALERVLTTTPWTEFDSAYKFRGEAVETFLNSQYPNAQALLCEATVVRLAQTKTTYSEQFFNFIGGWKPGRLENIRCLLKEPGLLDASGMLKARSWSKPVVKILLMTSTSELGSTTDGSRWLQYGETGTCKEADVEQKTTTVAGVIRNALLGRDNQSKRIISADEERLFFDGVSGIDIAGPEITCFTTAEENSGKGMETYKRLVREVYYACRERRAKGWHGKLLVHTHVGEGFVTYPIEKPKLPNGRMLKPERVSKLAPPGITPLADVFQTFPAISNDKTTSLPVHVAPARKNITVLLQAVRELKLEIADLDDFVVFRFGHVTHADLHDAEEMKALKIEADINLESNLATRVFDSPAIIPPTKLSEEEQFKYNDFPARTLETGEPAKILAGHSLKYMLEAGVRTLLGTDGGGEEHSDIAREYDLTQKLIDYWKANDPDFRKRVPRDLSVQVIYRNGDAHLRDLKEDKKIE